jgi:hypothetical protein
VFDKDTIGDARSAHSLASLLSTLRGTLRSAADETAHLVAVTDSDGRILWSEGRSFIATSSINTGHGAAPGHRGAGRAHVR